MKGEFTECRDKKGSNDQENGMERGSEQISNGEFNKTSLLQQKQRDKMQTYRIT